MNILKVLSLAAVLFCGCSRDGGHPDGDAGRAIRLGAELMATTKASINTGSEFMTSVAGWESSATQADFTTAKSWLVTPTITASENSVAVVLNPQPYYSQNSSIKTFLRAWYPAGTLQDDGIVVFAPQPDGMTDVLMSNIVSGSAKDNGAKSLVFSHILTQIKFVVICNAAFGTTTTIKSITVKDTQVPVGLNLSYNDAVYEVRPSLVVPSIGGEQLISTTATKIGAPIMVKPFTGNTFTIDVATSVTTYYDVVVTIDNDINFKAGKAYTITLTFSSENTQISTSTSVTPWTDGTGSAEIPTL